MAAFHTPVLCRTVLELLVTARNGIYVDATLGGGGHSAALLPMLSPDARVVGIDRDSEAIVVARSRLEIWANFDAIQGTFGRLAALLDGQGIHQVDGLLLDLGVSSRQLDAASRGFSHRFSATLDMRMDQQGGGMSAQAVVNEWPSRALVQALFTWGEEPQARRIARAIVASRPIANTTALAQVVRQVVPHRHEAKTLARVFQAIRIAVNEEMTELEAVLQQAPTLVKPGGRLVVLSYHSLEDRRVKRTMRHGNLAGEPMRDVFGNSLSPWRPLLKRPIMASAEEVQQNPRARSARLRAAERVIPDSD